ncbi:hypothetical protein TSUD_19280 [Trifolium subterraneum]|uniref:AP2/ERF domain-containing protein n=1 Tax=Trifolium subterraneum TaxID=3900 RepID=A0A2Z6MNU4_TRISU|nr:hypothetical protein TSUD_19280 [Trifolium subterraneum]
MDTESCSKSNLGKVGEDQGLEARSTEVLPSTVGLVDGSHIYGMGLWEAGLFRAYDRAAVMFRGVDADINFILGDYVEDLKQMKGLSKEEFIQRLRRQTNGNSRRSSTYRSALPIHKYPHEDPPFAAKT